MLYQIGLGILNSFSNSSASYSRFIISFVIVIFIMISLFFQKKNLTTFFKKKWNLQNSPKTIFQYCFMKVSSQPFSQRRG